MISGAHQRKFSGVLTAAIPQGFIKASPRQCSPTQLGAMYFDFPSMIRAYHGPTRHPIIADCLDLADDLAATTSLLFSFLLTALGQRSFYSIGNQDKSTPVLFYVHSLAILAHTGL